MAKVVVASLKPSPQAAKNAVGEKRVRDTDGRLKTVRTVDAQSSTFGDDLRYVFGKNVAKARRDNKRAIGSTDVAVPKP